MSTKEEQEWFNYAVDTIKGFGYKVYIHANKDIQGTYAYVTDGVNISYFQVGYCGGITFSTVHIPTKNYGDGFRLQTELRPLFTITEENILESFGNMRPEYTEFCGQEGIPRYSDFEDFKNNSPLGWNRDLIEI